MTSTAPLDTVESPAVGLDALDEAALLAEASETETLLRQGEVHRLRVAYQWAVTHPGLESCETPEGATLPSVLTEPETLGGEGTPPVAAFTAEPFALARGVSPGEAASMIADVLDLVHRLPLLWTEVEAGLVTAWKARRVAARTRHLSRQGARWIDRQTAGRASSLGVAALDRLVAEAAARCAPAEQADQEARARATWDVVLHHPDPGSFAGTSQLTATGDTLDLTRFHDAVLAEADTMSALGDTDPVGVRRAKALGVIADQQARLDLIGLGAEDVGGDTAARTAAIDRRAAKVRLYLHVSLTDLLGLTDGETGTVESLGPATVAKLKEWVGRSRVTLQPVLHVAADDRWSVDRHDPPPRMGEQVHLRDERCIFPWCTRPSRQCDLDHREPYVDPDHGGPPGQTRPDSLAPLCRRHHRAKTGGRWRYSRHGPGEYLWHGPGGVSALVTPRGTVRIPLN